MSDEIKKQFGKKVKYYRELRGFTQEFLAEKIEVNINSMSYIERGINFIKSETLDKICTALNVTPKELFDFDYMPQNPAELQLKIDTLLKKNETKLNKVYKILYEILN